jgi:copper chaperone CopZ
MMCDGCVAGVTAALKAVPKVVRVTSVDLASGVATCEVKAETMVRV